MTRKILGSLTAIALLALAGCTAPCKAHEGTVDGYCERTVAMNCRSTCADCIDDWEIQVCPIGCKVVEVKPAEGALPHSDPHLGTPAKWAVCTP